VLDSLDNLDRVSRDTVYRCVNIKSRCLADLADSIDDYLPPVAGRPNNLAQTGEPYQEFYHTGVCRDFVEDREIVSRHVLGAMSHSLTGYLMHPDGEKHVVYWRIRPEEDWITEGQHAGWVKYQVYCRLLRSDKPSLVE
jgi:hypothetical protein